MYLHVIFYDDRNFPEQVDWLDHPNDPNYWYPKFDVWYAYSIDGGYFWTNELLYEVDPNDPNDPPALEFADPNDLFEGFDPGEYIGISAYSNQVWTSFVGTWQPDPPDPKLEALIWSSRIDW